MMTAFPKEHMWAGKSLAFFYCTSAYDKHNDKQQFPPKLIGNSVVADGVLEPNSYQTLFRAVYFDTEKGVMREDYKERVVYQRIDWVRIKKKDPSIPLTLAGEPENNYTFFFDHNRVYLWATKERENPVFGLNVQPD